VDVITDANPTDHNRADTEVNVVTNLRRVVAFVTCPDAYVLPEGAVATDYRIGANHYSSEMIYAQSRTDSCLPRKMDANTHRDESIENSVRSP
jgi:hypothetical protein